MADKLNDVGWFYRGKMEQQFGPPSDTFVHTFFYLALAASTITGFIFLCSRLFDFIRLILSLFVLPGIPVRLPSAYYPVKGSLLLHHQV